MSIFWSRDVSLNLAPMLFRVEPSADCLEHSLNCRFGVHFNQLKTQSLCVEYCSPVNANSFGSAQSNNFINWVHDLSEAQQDFSLSKHRSRPAQPALS